MIKAREKHKELHALLERFERTCTTIRKACRNRRGPIREEWRRLIRQTEELGDPAGMLPHLRRREAELGKYYPELE